MLGAHIETVQTKAGLRIELIESGTGQTFFPNGSAVMNPVTVMALRLIGEELKALHAPIIIEGHTDARSFGEGDSYTNWELSADRANAARRMLESTGITADRVIEVRGMADRDLRVPSDPMNPSNRRISILLPFTTPENTAEPEDRLESHASVVRRAT
jgi:chemotaxis protein MotB